MIVLNVIKYALILVGKIEVYRYFPVFMHPNHIDQFHHDTPDEVLELKERFCRLWNALNSLPPAQGRRVDACIILGKSFSEVALAEGVDESAVRRAVERGLENMKKFLKNSR